MLAPPTPPRNPASHRRFAARQAYCCLDRNKQLADDNTRLRRQLARALGDERNGPDPIR